MKTEQEVAKTWYINYTPTDFEIQDMAGMAEQYAEPYKNALEQIKQIALSRKKGSIQAILEIIGELEK